MTCMRKRARPSLTYDYALIDFADAGTTEALEKGDCQGRVV
jgi:hypothetical protein